MANYSGCADIAADLISEPSRGTNLDIAATDQIRPIATTVAIAIIPARILLPLCVALIWARQGLHISGHSNVRQFTDLQSYFRAAAVVTASESRPADSIDKNKLRGIAPR